MREGEVGGAEFPAGGGARWGRVDDAVPDVTGNWVAIVVESALFGVVSKVFFEEEGFGGRVSAKGAFFTVAGGKARMGGAAAETSAEGTRVLALEFSVGIGIDGVVVGGRFRGGGGWRSGIVALENGLGWADEGGRWWR